MVFVIAALLGFLGPILVAAAVLGWHGLRGTSVGPAGALLIKLVSIVLRSE